MNQRNVLMTTKGSSSGFTLIELLITTGILILLTTATLVNLNISSTERQMDQAIEELTLAIAQARGFALAPPTDKSVGNAGYRLDLLANPGQSSLITHFEIHEIGSLPGQIPLQTSNILVTGSNFASKVGFRVADTQTLPTLTFSIPAQGRIISPQPADGLIHLEVLPRQGSGARKSVTISTITGQVDVSGSS